MATEEDLITARGSKLAPPAIMLAPSHQMKEERNINTQILVSQKVTNFIHQENQNERNKWWMNEWMNVMDEARVPVAHLPETKAFICRGLHAIRRKVVKMEKTTKLPPQGSGAGEGEVTSLIPSGKKWFFFYFLLFGWGGFLWLSSDLSVPIRKVTREEWPQYYHKRRRPLCIRP